MKRLNLLRIVEKQLVCYRSKRKKINDLKREGES